MDGFNQHEKIENAFKELNEYFGYALEYLDISSPPITGKDEQIDQLNKYLTREDTPVAMIIGLPGAGKTATVESWGHINAEKGTDVHLITVNIGGLGEGADLKKRISTLLPKLKEYEMFLKQFNESARVVLFIDEAHHIVSTFGKGSKEGSDLLKPYLARAGKYVGVIAATTLNEYNKYIAPDGALVRRFKNMIINEVNQETTVNILKTWLKNHTKTVFTENVDETILNKIVEENRRHNTELAEPAKSIDTLESLHAYSIDENIPIDEELLNRVFKAATNVDLNVNIDVIKANKVLKSRVRGQPLVLKSMDRTLKVMEFDERRGDRPMATILSVGTSGVGKTETAKATAEGTDKNLLIISMTNFNTPESAERFRRHLGSYIRHNRSSVILFDEVEKAHSTVQLSLLPILDEGLVTFFDKGQDDYEQPYTVSLKNTIIFGTSNKGAEIFGKINNYAKQITENKEEDIDKLTKDIQLMNRSLKPEIQRALKRDDFRPELLQRFSSIIPFATLGERVLIDIAEKQIKDMLKYFLSKGYDIRINPAQYWGDDSYPYTATEVAMYVAIERMINKKDAGSLGARNIRSIISEEIEGEILDAMYEYPGVKKFNLTTDGNCVFEEGDSAQSEGQLVVTPFMY